MRVSAIEVIKLCTAPAMSLLYQNKKIFLTCYFDFAENNFTSEMFPFLRVQSDVAQLLLPLVRQYGFHVRQQVLSGYQAGRYGFLFFSLLIDLLRVRDSTLTESLFLPSSTPTSTLTSTELSIALISFFFSPTRPPTTTSS